MKKIHSIIAVTLGLLSLLSSCGGNGAEFTLKGNLGTEKGEKILLVYDDPIAKIDTISTEKGKFEYHFIPDTITLMRIIDKDGNVIPVFADKGWTVNFKGSFTNYSIEGDGPNRDYQDFLNTIEEVKSNEEISQKAEEFILSHPQSFASAYLINRYFIQVAHPDIDKINELITPLNGEIKDSRVLNVAMKSIPSKETNPKTHLNYFSIRNRDSQYITWNNKNGKYILINFWASWDANSITARDQLVSTLNELPKGQLKVISVSLDYDKDKWLNSCIKDTDNWIETCDFNGWEMPLVKQNNIISLPSNILIDNQRKIIAKDIYGKSLANTMNQQTE